MASASGLFRRSSAKSLDMDTPEAQAPSSSSSSTSTTTTTHSFGTATATSAGRVKKECSAFEPQQWRKTVCKNCFRTQPEHKTSNGRDEVFGGSTVKLRRADNGNQFFNTQSAADSGNNMQDNKSGRDNGKAGGNHTSNAARAAARKIAVGQRSSEDNHNQATPIPEARRSSANSVNPTAPGIYSSASSIDARYIEELENDFFALEDKHEAVLRERDQLNAELDAKIRTVAELQTTLDQYREKVTLLEKRCTHMDEEIKGYRERLRLPESDQSPSPGDRSTRENGNASPSAAGDTACTSELQQRLNEVEQLCQEVMEENEQLKEEVEEMQREIEEMHDHFQEDDRDAMRELQRELEAANKACRILQFKLRKAERRFEQCEAERANLEERLARLEAELYSEADIAHIRNLEEEIRVAKEVGVRLNNELDILDEKRAFYEEESRQLKDELHASQASRIAAENELGRLRLEIEKIKLERGILDKGPLQVTDKNRSRQVGGGRPSLSREASFEEQQLQRELEATRERETDLSEQLRYADEENRKLKRRMKEVQVENELLSKKLDRILATQPREQFDFSQMAKASSTCAPNTDEKVVQEKTGMNTTDAQLESALSMTRRQLSLVAEENVGLRKKVLGYERESMLNMDENQKGISRQSRGVHPDALELDQLRSQLNLIQDHLARIEQERERLEGENRLLRHGPNGSLTEDQLTQENSLLKERMKEWDRRLRQITREVSLVGSVERDHEWMDKYNEAREAIKDQELQLSRSKRRIAELQDENANLRSIDRKIEQRNKREREKSDASPHLSRDALVQEVKTLEEELDEVTADLTAAREQACTAQLRVTYLEDSNAELRADAERRERELMAYVVHVDSKNQVVTQILSLLQERLECAQNEIDRINEVAQSDECMMASTDSQFSASSTLSAGSDDVFQEKIDSLGKQNIENETLLRKRINSLEIELKEERKRVKLVEDQFNRLTKEGVGSVGNVEVQFRVRQMDLLKKELEEKDELLEAKDEQIADLRARIEQSRKMNDALRALMEKDTGAERQSTAPKTEHNVEVASYRREIESSRKEMQILRNNLAQADKIRERLMKDNRELQEELKLREDSIFEQDDEIEKRNAELRAVKMTVESMQKELEQTRRDLSEAKARESSGSSGRLSAQIVQNERIRTELHETTRELNDIRLKYEDAKRALSTAEDKCSQLSSDLTQVRNSLQEKDAIIIDLNKNLQIATEEVGQCKLDGQTARIEKIDLEKQLADATNKISAKEKECVQLQTLLQEATAAARESDRVGSSHDSGIGTPEGSRSRDGTLSRRSAEVDRLRRELSMMRSEREELLAEVKRLRLKLEKRLQSDQAGQKCADIDLTGLPKGNAYAKALVAQQSTTKISLLNEHIGYLNRINVDLKLQNESLQNHVIDYQRRYRSLREQYEGEQESWLTERVVLESKAKEQEDRKLTIANTRKLLQEATAKLCEVESGALEKYQKLEQAYEKLEKEKMSLESKLAQLEEQQKLPKVLQRFGATGSAARASVLAAAAQSRSNSTENTELARRMESAERTVAKLRAELTETKSSFSNSHRAALEDAENARHAAEQEAEDLRDRLVTMECYRQQAELFRHRQFETEENAEKEFKIWQEERESLLYRTEEARVMIEQWFTQLQCRTSDDLDKANEVVNEVLKQMEKWRASRGKVPCLKRRMLESLTAFDSGTGAGSVPSSPATTLWRTHPLGSIAQSNSSAGLRTHAQRSTSMEWGNGRLGLANTPTILANYRESSLGAVATGNLPGSSISLAMGASVGGGSNYSLLMAARCGRSVSPEVTVRKLSNYPDPTPGFLVRPNSRHGSRDSLCNAGDYTQRSFTLPGKPPMRSAISPARRKFFEEATSPNLSSVDMKQSPHQSGEKLTDSTKTTDIPMIHPAKSVPGNGEMKEQSSDKSILKKSSQMVEAEVNVPSNRKSSSSSLSIADRFVKWSSSGSQTTSKSTVINGDAKPNETNKTPIKKFENELKIKSRGKSPHASSETRELNVLRIEQSGSGEQAPALTTKAPEKSSTSSKSIKRSGSVSNISPAIMALRQKFIGGTK